MSPTLEEANVMLLKAFKEYEEIARKLPALEYEYDSRYSEMYVKSGMGTGPLKEAEAKSILNEEGLGKRLAEMKMEVRILYNKYQVLIEYTRNLRSIMTRDSWQG